MLVPLSAGTAAPALERDPLPPLVDEPRPTAFEDLRGLVRDLRNSRDLIQQLTLRDIRIRYKQAALGFLWALLIPIVIVLSGLLLRTAIAYASHTPLRGDQIAGMAIKSVPWAFFVGCLNVTTASLLSNQQLITKVYFPREVLPLAALLAQTFDSSIGLLIVGAVLSFFGVGFSLQLLWAPVLLINLWLLCAGLGLFLSCANLLFRDVKYLVQVFLSFGIFVTPVFMDASMYGPKIAPLIMMNPVAPLLEGLRLSVVEHHNLLLPYVAPKGGFVVWHPWYLAYSGGVALVILFGSALLFQRSERYFAEIV